MRDPWAPLGLHRAQPILRSLVGTNALSQHRPAARHRDQCAGHVAAAVAGQQDIGRRQFGRLPGAFLDRGRFNVQLVLLVIAYSAAIQFVWLNYAANSDYWIPYKIGASNSASVVRMPSDLSLDVKKAFMPSSWEIGYVMSFNSKKVLQANWASPGVPAMIASIRSAPILSRPKAKSSRAIF